MPETDGEMFLGAQRIYDLEQTRQADAPYMAVHAVGYTYTLHRHHQANARDPRSGASGVLIAGDHNGTHIDALCHQAEGLALYGGIQIDGRTQTPTGFTSYGAETIDPIVCRGVLLDVARHKDVPYLPLGTTISRSLLQETAAAQETTIHSGDVVLVRTGAGALWHAPAEYVRAAGMEAGASAWLADLGVRAVGADNIAWDLDSPTIDPMTETSFPGHVILLVRHGIHIIENLNLEELSRDHVHECTFICLPPELKGATGAPVRPVAVVQG
ncbi:MAG: cyclase family protein [Chloroflexota bacterium]